MEDCSAVMYLTRHYTNKIIFLCGQMLLMGIYTNHII